MLIKILMTEKNCRWCCSKIPTQASTCAHCGRSQSWLWTHAASIAALVSVIAICLSFWQAYEASLERSDAEAAVAKAKEIESGLRETLIELRSLSKASQEDRSKLADQENSLKNLNILVKESEKRLRSVDKLANNSIEKSNVLLIKTTALSEELKKIESSAKLELAKIEKVRSSAEMLYSLLQASYNTISHSLLALDFSDVMALTLESQEICIDNKPIILGNRKCANCKRLI